MTTQGLELTHPTAEAGSAAPPLTLSKQVLFSSAGVGSGMFNAFFNSALPLFLLRYDLPLALVGLLAQERSLLGSPLEPVVGTVSDRIRTRLGRRRPFFLVGIPLAALSLLVLSQQPSIYVLVALLLFMPFFLAIANVPYRAMIPDIAVPSVRGRLGGIISLFEMAGQVGILVLLAVIWESNETVVFVVIALALVVGFGITFFSTKEPPPPAAVPKAKLALPLTYIRHVLAFREAAKYVGCQFVFWFGVGGVTPFLTRYAVSVLGMSEQMSFMMFLLLVAFTALFAIPAGYAGDRLGKRRVLIVGLLVFSAAAFFGSQAQTVTQLAVALCLVGFANGIMMALGFVFLTELLPRQRMGELTGLSGMTWSLAQPLGSTFFGFVADQTGTLRTVMLLTSIVIFLSFLILMTVKPSRAAAEVAGG